MDQWLGLAGVLGPLLLAGFGVREIRRIGLGANDAAKSQIFLRGGGLLLAGLVAGVLVFCYWVALGGIVAILAFSESEWFSNNFEVLLIISSVLIIGISDWVARAWIDTTTFSIVRAERVREINLFSMTFACAIGVLVLVAIGSSVFTARVAQINFAQASSSLPVMHISRALLTARELDEYQRETEAIDREIVRTRDAFYRQEEMLRGLQLGVVRENPEDAQRQATDEQGRLAARHNRLIENSQRALRERECVIRALAERIAIQSGWRATEAYPRFPPLPAPSNCPYTDFSLSQYSAAENLTATVAPLLRTWMSTQLVWRAPVVLSIELVLVMGALGALLRAATPYLVAFVGRLGGAKTYEPPEQSEYLMMTLALHVVFGMSTALIFFILLKTGVSAAELTTVGTEGVEADLNPFSMAALGLLGGYASLNVAAWIGRIGEDLTQGGAAARQDTATSVEQNVAVGLMLNIREFLKLR